jgi:hypothetical protein
MSAAVTILDEVALRRIVAEEVARLIEPLRAEIKAAHQPPAALMGPDELAKLLDVHPRTLHRMELAGDIPPAFRVGTKVIRWQRATLARWLESGGKDLSIRRGKR